MRRITLLFLLMVAVVGCNKENGDGNYKYGQVREYTIDSAHATIDGKSGRPAGYNIKAGSGEWQYVDAISGVLLEGSRLREDGVIIRSGNPEESYVDGNVYVVKGKVGSKKRPDYNAVVTVKDLHVISVISVTPDENDDVKKFGHTGCRFE